MPTKSRITKNRSNREMILYLREISKIPLLTPGEEIEIGTRARQGDLSAQQMLIESNLRFVIKIAKVYRGCGLPFMDLINEGNMGLIEAAKRFDPTRGVKFTSYAVWWIRQSILQALANLSHPMRLPHKVSVGLYRMKLALNRQSYELSRRPTEQELANEVGIQVDDLRSLLDVAGGSVSLNQPVDSTGEICIGDQLEQTSIQQLEESVSAKFLIKLLNEALNELSETERKILQLRFGLQDTTPHTLREIGDMMGVSRERIRQVECKALQKLQQAGKAKSLATYLS
jgi:RNA polymerase primary sigma factor